MGREGVAYTFVTPEEGGELTRIEMRIDRLLKRDEIPGFEAIASREPVAAPQVGSADADGRSPRSCSAEPSRQEAAAMAATGARSSGSAGRCKQRSGFQDACRCA